VRIVALSAEPSLSAALNMMADWEVAFASEVEQAVQLTVGAAVVLIGGGTEEGLRLAEALRSLGVTIPAVIVGDSAVPEDARYPVITPPFTLQELGQVIVRAAGGAKQSRPPTSSPLGTPPEKTGNGELAPMRDSSPTKPPSVAPSSSGSGATPTEPTPAKMVEPSELKVAEPARPPAAPRTAVAPSPVRPAEQRAPAATPTVPAEPVSAGPATSPPRESSIGRGLLRRRHKEVELVEDSLSDTLRAAAEGLSKIEEAMEELPVLTDLHELTEALLGEVVELLQPQTAAVYLPGPDGFRVWASHGFANVERTMAVQTHQPLFADILVRHEAVLIEPIDLAVSLVAGIGGARTNAFIASPVEANSKCIGVIVAGRDHFENEDLDRLENLVEEASLGLAVALGLDRLKMGLL
jgi:hypothetical protein